ncbi:ankyrin repeat domain-containing protein, partial [archaeon]
MNPGEHLVELARQNVSYDEFCQEARDIERKDATSWPVALNFQHPEENNVPALSFFIRKQRSDLVRFYLQEGCDVELMDLRHVGALGVASIFGDQESVQLLVEYQTNANTKCALGCSNLLFAVHLQHIEAVKYLVEQGKASVSERDRNGCGPLLIASMVGSLPIAKYLLTHTNVSISDRHVNGWSAIVFAAYHGTLDLVMYLDSVLRNNGHANYTSLSLDIQQDYNQCLVLAAKCGYLFMVKFLVDTVKVTVDARDSSLNTPLICSSVAGHENIVSYLLQQEADVNKVNADGDTALMLAVRRGYLPIVKLLLEGAGMVGVGRRVGVE